MNSGSISVFLRDFCRAVLYDPVRDEAELYARRLQTAGVPILLSRYDGMIHGFFRMFAVFKQSKVALKEVTTALATVFRHAM